MIEKPKIGLWELFLTIGGFLFLVLGIVLVLTNPKPQDYEFFATKNLILYLKENVCQSQNKSLEEILKGEVCHLMVNTGEKQVPKLIATTTQRHNYLLLSVYETNLYLYNFETIGIFNEFYVIGVDKLYDQK